MGNIANCLVVIATTQWAPVVGWRYGVTVTGTVGPRGTPGESPRRSIPLPQFRSGSEIADNRTLVHKR